MKKKIHMAAVGVLAMVLAVSGVMVARRWIDYRRGSADYDEAAQLAALPDLDALTAALATASPAVSAAPTPAPTPSPTPSAAPTPSESASPVPETPSEGPTATPEPTPSPAPVYVDPYADALRNMDFTALREVNSEVLGWIVIPGTRLSYPIVQGSDNEYYLNHTWRKNRNAVGAIFLECQNSADLSDFNTIIYGHRMADSSMFHTLLSYKDQSYWEEHPCVYISDDAGSHTYRIYAAYEVGVTEMTYRLGAFDEAARQEFIAFGLEHSAIITGAPPSADARVLTLSTCTGNGHETRWVVQAVLEGE